MFLHCTHFDIQSWMDHKVSERQLPPRVEAKYSTASRICDVSVSSQSMSIPLHSAPYILFTFSRKLYLPTSFSHSEISPPFPPPTATVWLVQFTLIFDLQAIFEMVSRRRQCLENTSEDDDDKTSDSCGWEDQIVKGVDFHCMYFNLTDSTMSH